MPPPPESLCALPGGGREAWPCGQASQTGKDHRAKGAGPHRLGVTKPPPYSADPSTPTRRPLPTALRTLRTPKPGLRRRPRPQQPHAKSKSLGSHVESQARKSQPERLGRDQALVTPLVPAPPLRGEEQPIPALISKARPMCGPVVQEEPTSCAVLAYRRPDLLWARVPLSVHARASRSRIPCQWGRATVRSLGWWVRVCAVRRSFPACVPHPNSCIYSFIHFAQGTNLYSRRAIALGGGPRVLVRIYIFI